ncbi:MAG: prohibitin family protein [Puniceicoccales bacterium]|jgi:prohibitin 2|nr:prohibitin family protein [Puniceicoccales bacterium]
MKITKISAAIAVILALIAAVFEATFVVDPGDRGVLVTLGTVNPKFEPEGFGIKTPFISRIVPVLVRQQARELPSECYSSDLQQVKVNLRILYKIPEQSVVKIYQDYAGEPFTSLIAPRVQESLKEATALQSAEQIVRQRENIKNQALEGARKKIGALLDVVDLVIEDISLSQQLEAAIESKMVQEQEAAKARFTQQKAEIEASTAIIRAKGEAEAIRIRGEALRNNPTLIDLQIVEKWDGRSPLVVGGNGNGGANILLPLTVTATGSPDNKGKH